jgi:Leucine-rich repeat (LRR) protein
MAQIVAKLEYAKRSQGFTAVKSNLSEIPRGLFELFVVKDVNVSDNQIQCVPDAIQHLTELVTLKLSRNSISSISEHIGSIVTLVKLFLNGNQLTSLPRSLGNLSNLALLALENNPRLKQLPHELGRVKKTLVDFTYDADIIEEPEPVVLKSGQRQVLNYLSQVSDNYNLSTISLRQWDLLTFPPGMFDFSSATSLCFTGHKVRQLQEEFFWTFTNLTSLSLDNNNLEILSPLIVHLSKLQSLSVCGNLLTSLPVEVGGIESLQKLKADWGAIISPTRDVTRQGESATLNYLSILYFSRFSGSLNSSYRILTQLPSEICDLTSLTALDLSNNEIGALNNKITSLAQLRSLNFSNNYFYDFPTLAFALPSIEEVVLDNNNIPELPEAIKVATCLKKLSLRSNRIGQMSDWISVLRNLKELDVAHNCIEQLPKALSSFQFLMHLDISANAIQDIPSLNMASTSMRTLCLDKNPLKSLPSTILYLNELRWMSVADCKLETVSHVIDGLRSVEYLNFLGNPLREIDPAIGSCFKLRTLLCDLTLEHPSKDITGRGLPVMLELERDMQEGRISMNVTLSDLCLSIFPQEICYVTSITRLDISRNAVLDIPGRFFKSCSRLREMDASHNNIVHIPSEIEHCVHLESLDLRGNSAFESLPVSIGSLRELADIFIPSCARIPPREVVLQGSDSIMSYMRSCFDSISSAALDLNDFGASSCDVLKELPPTLSRIYFKSNQLQTVEFFPSILQKLTEIDLSVNSLRTLPSYFAEYAILKYLDIASNNIYDFPLCVTALRELKYLNLSSNSIFTIPCLSSLQNLEVLDLSSNNFSTLGSELANLSNLKELQLNRNPFRSEIVPQIETMVNLEKLVLLDITCGHSLASGVATLSSLTQLVISVDTLVFPPPEVARQIPHAIRFLSAYFSAPTMHSLSIRDMKLCVVPMEFFFLTNLQKLEVLSCQLELLIPKYSKALAEKVSLSISRDIQKLLDESAVSEDEVVALEKALLVKWAKLQTLCVCENSLRQLPKELGCLSALTHLDLRSNSLEQLPESIGSIQSLRALHLKGNPIPYLPYQFGNLTHLVDLTVDFKVIVYPPPQVIGMGSLRSIEFLQSFVKAKKLKTLLLEDFKLEDIPSDIFQDKVISGFCDSIKELSLKGNNISDIGLKLDMLSNLTVINLNENRIEDAAFLIRMKGLVEISCDGNKLREFADEANSIVDLAHLSIARNELSDLPHSFRRMYNLLSLVLDFNLFIDFPTSVCGCIRLQSLSLKGNRIDRVPPEITKMTSLTSLNMDNNRMRDIPVEFAHLKSLKKLSLMGNPIEEIDIGIAEALNGWDLSLQSKYLQSPPAEVYDNGKSLVQEYLWAVQTSVRFFSIDLRNWKLQRFPDPLVKYTAITNLRLTKNSIRTLPDSFGVMKLLHNLEVSENQLERLPDTLCSIKKLQFLEASKNSLALLPDEIGELEGLASLSVHHNHLKLLPASFWNLTALQNLDLSFNRLVSLPQNIGGRRLLRVTGPFIQGLKNLRVMRLSNNRLTSLPMSVQGLDAVEEVYLLCNPLSVFPDPLLRNRNLHILRVSVGKLAVLKDKGLENVIGATWEPPKAVVFKGTKSIVQYVKKILDAAGNSEMYLENLELNKFPSEICYAKNLLFLSLRKNELVKLSSAICFLKMLQYLDVAYNHISKVTERIHELQFLRSVDLTSNELVILPASFGSLSLLESVLVKKNKMAYPFIESSGNMKTLKTFIASLYESFITARLEVSRKEYTLFPSYFALTCRDMLTVFDVSFNSIRTVPPAVGS